MVAPAPGDCAEVNAALPRIAAARRQWLAPATWRPPHKNARRREAHHKLAGVVAMAQLGLHGGPKAVRLSEPDAFRWPPVSDDLIEAAAEVIRSGNWSLHRVSRELEERFAQYIGTKFALSHNNGTAAIHAAMFAVGVGPGDEVICQSYTYWASIMPALALGAIPVFCEIEERTLGLDPEDLERKITDRTKAIVVVHLHGVPSDMDAIMQIARRHGVAVIEDASHAHGARLNGRMIGSIGDIGAFSMQTSKLLPSGEGGMLTTDSQDYYERAVLLGHYERLGEVSNEKYRSYQRTCLGFKYRIHPVAAAIALHMLDRLDELNKRRNENLNRFYSQIADLPGVQLIEGVPGAEPVHYESAFLYKPWELGGLPLPKFIEALHAEGATGFGGVRYAGLHQQPLFLDLERHGRAEIYTVPKLPDGKPRYGPGTLPKTEDIMSRVVLTPTFPNASPELVDQYAEAVKKVVAHHKELL